MRSERFWVLILSLTTFCAGLAAGVLISSWREAGRESRPFGNYEGRMIEAFDLDEERLRNLRYILQDYQEQIDALKLKNLASLDTELVRIGRDHRELIRSWVVPAHHQQEFDLWAGGLPVLPSGSKPQ